MPDALPPIGQIRLKNFKSTEDEKVELRALTVVIGSNSAGKSSLLNALMLLAQSVQAPTPRAVFPLNGHLTDQGYFHQVKRLGAPGVSSVLLGVTMNSPVPRPGGPRMRRPGDDDWTVELDVEIKGEDEFDPASSTVRRVVFCAQGVSGLSLKVDVRRVGANPERIPPDDTIPSPSFRTRVGDTTDLLRGTLKIKDPTKRIENADEKIASVGLRGSIPTALTIRRHRRDAQVENVLRDLQEHVDRMARSSELRRGKVPALTAERRERLNEFANLIVRWIQEPQSPEEQAPVSLRWLREVIALGDDFPTDPTTFRLLHAHRATIRKTVAAQLPAGAVVAVPFENETGHLPLIRASSSATAILDSIRHLGGLRVAPQPLYPTTSRAQQGDLGRDGQFTAAVFYAKREQMVRCFDRDGTNSNRTLADAVAYWAEILELFDSVEPHHQAALGLDLKVRLPGLDKDLDITAVGLGVSQFLPVLLRCLLTNPDEVVLLEQPELHLHPASQQKLADFLLACALSGRQLIVETHSEHLVNRLRRLSADSTDDRITDAVGLVFAERDPKTGSTKYRNSFLNAYGGLTDWPKDFMGEGMSDATAILEAGVRKLREEGDGATGP